MEALRVLATPLSDANIGFLRGREDGQVGIYDPVAACAVNHPDLAPKNQTACTDCYKKGYVQACTIGKFGCGDDNYKVIAMKHKIEKYISIDVGVFNSNHLFIYFMIVMGLVLGSITFPSFIPVAVFLAGVGATILVYTMGKANKVTK